MRSSQIYNLLVTIAAMTMMLNSSTSSAIWLDSQSTNDSFSAWIPLLWKQTTQSDFSLDTLTHLDTQTSPGDVSLAFTPRLYAFGGGTNHFWRFDDSTGSWITTLAQPTGNVQAGAALVSDGKDFLYALQGNSATFWRYNTSANTWETRASTPLTVRSGGNLVFYNSTLLYAFRGGGTATFWSYNIVSNTWTRLNDAPGSMSSDSAICTDGAGHIYALQGNNQAAFWRYSIARNQWAAMQPTPQRTGSGNALAYDPYTKQIYALRGNNQYDFWRYDITTNRWYATLSSTPSRVNFGGNLVVASQNDLYAFRGGATTVFWHYSITQNRWTRDTATPMPGVRTGGSFTVGPPAYISNGEIDSLVLNTAQLDCKIRGVFWNITTPANTAIDVQIRASNSLVGAVPNSAWIDLHQTSPAVAGLPFGQYIQWRVVLTSNDVNKTPLLQEVRVYYT